MKMNTASAHRSIVSRKNEGFTLIEMLLNLAIMVMIVSLFPLIIINISQFKAISSESYDINKEMCLRDIIAEIQDKKLSVSGTELIARDLTMGRKYGYSFHQSRVIRKVDGTGYIILLEHVKSAKFFEDNQHYYLELEWMDKWRAKHETFQLQ
ncbi:ComGF family competence protein [Macrococcus carouselicus]|nr:ComGF family competence protein [Macrococcus carouselicus]